MLTFVGLGLYDERSVTVRAQDCIREADQVFAEFYTSTLTGTSIERLEAYHGVQIEVRERSGVEDDPAPILEAARSGNVVFLTAGDSMISTTHVDLRLRAIDQGIETRIIHGTTAQSAASGLTGLQNYRFGKATTLPFPESHGGAGVPASVLETVEENRERGLHTLVYLDIDVERDKHMTIGRATELLDTHLGDNLAVGIARAGGDDPVVKADRLRNLTLHEFGDPLHLLVIPGSLHHVEQTALKELAGVSTELIAEI